jgi:hypothetical protein
MKRHISPELRGLFMEKKRRIAKGANVKAVAQVVKVAPPPQQVPDTPPEAQEATEEQLIELRRLVALHIACGERRNAELKATLEKRGREARYASQMLILDICRQQQEYQQQKEARKEVLRQETRGLLDKLLAKTTTVTVDKVFL